MLCPECGGQGWKEIIPDHTGLICKICHGLGEIPDEDNEEIKEEVQDNR